MQLTHKAGAGLEEDESSSKSEQTRRASALRSPILALSCALITLPVLSTPCAAQQFSFTISATANIFGDGYGDAPAPGGYGGGTTAPFRSFVTSAGQYVTVTNVSGSVSYVAGELNGTEGGPAAFFAENYRSLSGVSDPRVFSISSACLPTGHRPAPLRRNISFSSKSAPSYQPLLNQVFFIGDGLTGTGTDSVQEFFTPAGATKLTLGFADADAQGNIGSYNDNVG